MKDFNLFQPVKKLDFLKKVKEDFKYLEQYNQSLEEILNFYIGDLKKYDIFYLGKYEPRDIYYRYLGYNKNSMFIYSSGLVYN